MLQVAPIGAHFVTLAAPIGASKLASHISPVLVVVPHVFKHLSSNSSKQGSKDVMKYDRLKIGVIKIKIEPFGCALN